MMEKTDNNEDGRISCRYSIGAYINYKSSSFSVGKRFSLTKANKAVRTISVGLC